MPHRKYLKKKWGSLWVPPTKGERVTIIPMSARAQQSYLILGPYFLDSMLKWSGRRGTLLQSRLVRTGATLGATFFVWALVAPLVPLLQCVLYLDLVPPLVPPLVWYQPAATSKDGFSMAHPMSYLLPLPNVRNILDINWHEDEEGRVNLNN